MIPRTPITKNEIIGFEEHIAQLFIARKIRVPIHLSGSKDGKYEDTLISLFRDRIHPTDYVFSTHRNHYHYLLHTGDAHGLLHEILGDAQGVCHGNAGSMHIINRNANFFSSAIVAGTVSIAVGVAWALKRKGSTHRVWCFIGDGATDSGYFMEAWRYVEGFDLPLTFVVEHNDRSVCTDVKTRWGEMSDLTYDNDHMLVLEYESKYPHTGAGSWVEF